MKTIKDNRIIVGPARLSYLSVYEPRLNNMKKDRKTGEPVKEFSVTLLFPKVASKFQANPQMEAKDIVDATKKIFAEAFPKVMKWDNPFKDGDTETDTEGNPRYAGYWYMNTKCGEKYPPVLMNAKKEHVTSESGWVSGDWAKANVTLYAFEYEGKYGIGVGLNALQFLYKDDPLGSSNDPETVRGEFDEEEGDDPTAALAGVGAGVSAEEYDPFRD